jgi:hypothetical protein
MAYLIFILAALALFIGFLILSGYESRRGMRIFATGRVRLDENVERAEFILTHVNLGSFLREEMRLIAHRVVHDIAHLSLIAVRAVERFLTHIVRYLRAQHAVNEAPRENAREFVKTLSDFKGHLEETRPEVPDVLE